MFADIFQSRRRDDQWAILPQDLGELQVHASESRPFERGAKFKFVMSNTRTWRSSKAVVNRIMGFPAPVIKRWLCSIWHACLLSTAGRKLFELEETDRCNRWDKRVNCQEACFCNWTHFELVEERR